MSLINTRAKPLVRLTFTPFIFAHWDFNWEFKWNPKTNNFHFHLFRVLLCMLLDRTSLMFEAD